MDKIENQRKVHIIVKGMVQGVGFRYYTRAVGQELGISGWVKNLSSGDVEVLGAGNSGHIDEFIRRVSKGPPHSHVTHMDVSEVSDYDASQDSSDANVIDINEGFKILL
ncbi:MAG: acylphosphatase [Methanosarcinales archaeon]|nr:acylphosphatase [Methanosarcinales archaeon]